MFDAISLFGAFTVVETVNRTHQIAGDTADALKTDTFAHHLDGLLFKHGSAALGLRFAWSLALLDSMSNFKTNCSMLKS